MADEQVSPLAKIWTRSLHDPEFRARLLAQPRKALEDDMGLIVSDKVKLNVVENTATSYTIVLPPMSDAHVDDNARVQHGYVYHIPEWNTVSALQLADVEQRPSQPGFGANPHPRTGRTPDGSG